MNSCNPVSVALFWAQVYDPESFNLMQALLLAQLLEAEDDWCGNVADVLSVFEEQTGRTSLYSVVFF